MYFSIDLSEVFRRLLMEFIRENQLTLMLFLCGVCAALSVMVCVSDSIPPRRRVSLLMMELSALVLLTADRYAYIYRGDTSELGYRMVHICNFVVFYMYLMEILAFNMYLKNMFTGDGRINEKSRLLQAVDVLLIISTITLIVSQFTGFFYSFDDQNRYHRNNGMVIWYILSLSTLVLQITELFRKRKAISKKMFPAVMLFAVVPVMATVVQIFTYGISLTNISIVGMAILLYIISLADMNEKVKWAADNEISMLKIEQGNMETMFEQTALALANAIDAKDKYTHGHSRRVAEYSKILAEKAGKAPEECRDIYYSALLHDVGKIGVPDHIINKEGRLTDEEFEAIKTHPAIGDQILSSISISPQLSIGARHHHERFDGKGYPDKLKGNDIPEIARIIAVADAYDAMTSKRSYRDPLPQQLVREEIVKGMDTQFDPVYAKIMLHLIDLDMEYTMKESAEAKELSGKSKLECREFRTEFSQGIQILHNESVMHLRSRTAPEAVSLEAIPTIVIFDSLDARVHYNDSNSQRLLYFEYAEIRLDGETKCLGARKTQKKVLKDERPDDETLLAEYHNGFEYKINAIKYKDHLRITIENKYYVFETIIALPDSSRYAYIGFTGQDCVIDGFSLEHTELVSNEDTIERIAPFTSYIDVPSGDIPNIQIDGWRTDATQGVEFFGELSLSFHYMSLPTARLVWHCPFIVLYCADDATVGGKNYRELAIIRFDGESWDQDEKVSNNMMVSKNIDFISWDKWREGNKLGVDCVLDITRKNNSIIMQTEINGLSLKNITTIEDYPITKIYVAVTGDQVAVTDIHIKKTQEGY